MAPAAMNTTAAASEKEKEKALQDLPPITSSRNAKWWYSAFPNVTAMVGAGVLSLPYNMSELGWTFNDEITEDVIFSAAFPNVTAMVGAGVLILPYNMSELGWTFNDEITEDVIFSAAFPNVTAMVGAGVLILPYNMSELGCFCKGAPLNSSGYGEERGDSDIHALGLPESRAGDRGSSSTGTLGPRFYLDSGAAHHVVNDDTILINVRDPPAGMRVIVADGSAHLVTKVGDIQTTAIKIKDVYHVPQLQVCLVSVSQLTERNIDITFSGNRVVLLLDGTRIGDAILDDAKMYRLCSLQAP